MSKDFLFEVVSVSDILFPVICCSAGTVFWHRYQSIEGSEATETMEEPIGLRGGTNNFTMTNNASYGEAQLPPTICAFLLYHSFATGDWFLALDFTFLFLPLLLCSGAYWATEATKLIAASSANLGEVGWEGEGMLFQSIISIDVVDFEAPLPSFSLALHDYYDQAVVTENSNFAQVVRGIGHSCPYKYII